MKLQPNIVEYYPFIQSDNLWLKTKIHPNIKVLQDNHHKSKVDSYIWHCRENFSLMQILVVSE